MRMATLSRAWYWATFAVEAGKRGALHEARNCAAFRNQEADVRIGRKIAQALIDAGKARRCRRCSRMT